MLYVSQTLSNLQFSILAVEYFTTHLAKHPSQQHKNTRHLTWSNKQICIYHRTVGGAYPRLDAQSLHELLRILVGDKRRHVVCLQGGHQADAQPNLVRFILAEVAAMG